MGYVPGPVDVLVRGGRERRHDGARAHGHEQRVAALPGAGRVAHALATPHAARLTAARHGQRLDHGVDAGARRVGGRYELRQRQVLAARHEALVLRGMRSALHVHEEGRRQQVRRRVGLLVVRAARRVQHHGPVVGVEEQLGRQGSEQPVSAPEPQQQQVPVRVGGRHGAAGAPLGVEDGAVAVTCRERGSHIWFTTQWRAPLKGAAYPTLYYLLLVQPGFRLAKRDTTFMGYCLKCYNKIPQNILELNETKFKTCIKRTLCERAYYKLGDYYSR